MTTKISRRGLLRTGATIAGGAGIGAFYGPWKHNRAYAQSGAPIRIGLTCDASGMYGASGRDELRGILMCIDEFNANGGVLGRQIEWVTADTETNPATASRVAERFITREDCSILIGAIHSGVANAITQVASKYGTIYLNSNSSSPSESGENCNRIKFVWDGSGTNFATATVNLATERVGKKWLLLTNDYVWGHETSAATRALVDTAGGEIVDELLVPQNTRDFTAYLLAIQQAKPEVVAPAVGGDDGKILRAQVAELGLDRDIAWVQSQQDFPDVWAAPESAIGIFGTNWYYRLDLPGVLEFVERWKARAANDPEMIPIPGNTSFCGYMAMRETLRAMERVESTNNVDIIKELEQLRIPAADRLQDFDAYMDPETHQLQQTLYLARRNPAPTEDADIYELIAAARPEDVVDPASRANCVMLPYEEVPVVDG